MPKIMGEPAMGEPTEDERQDEPEVLANVGIVLRPIGAPTPLGFFGLAAATLVLSGLHLGWVDRAEAGTVGLVLIGFAFPAQILAAIFSFLARDGAVATAMAVLALNWLVVGLVMRLSAPGSTSAALGLFLLVAAVAIAISALTAALSRLVPACVLLVAAARLLVTGFYEITASRSWGDVAGVIGLVLFAFAVYAAWAADLEDAAGRTLLPFGRRGKHATAFGGGLHEQIREVATEPGVRSQL